MSREIFFDSKEFERGGFQTFTKCPHNMGYTDKFRFVTNVGSTGCTECPNFIRDGVKNKSIICGVGKKWG